MPIQSRYFFCAAMDVTSDKEAAFHEVYDNEHIPLITKVPGVVAAVRFKTEELTMIIGGEKKKMVVETDVDRRIMELPPDARELWQRIRRREGAC